MAPERHRAILGILADSGGMSTKRLRAELGISAATLRRDITSLAGRSLLRRTHGGILPVDFSLRESPHEQKAAQAATIKSFIGQTAAGLLPTHGVVFIDGGTTCLEVGLALLDRAKLQIFTNSVPLLAMANEARAVLVGVGGSVRPNSLSMIGGLAQDWMEHLCFDVAVVGCSGIQTGRGPATVDLSDAALKTEVLRRSRLRLLVAHAEKWSRPATIAFAPWKAFTHVVTDRVLTPEENATLHKANVTVRRIASAAVRSKR